MAPVGFVAFGLIGLVLQSLHWTMPAWAAGLLLVTVPSIVNGLFWGGIAEAIAWARVRVRVLFWVLVLGLGVYWTFALALLAFR